MLAAFERLAAERCLTWVGRLIESNGEAEHVHMLIELPPTVVLAEFVNAQKTGASRRLRSGVREHLAAAYRTPVLWSRSYCALSCGGG